jgi:hypothetical protein
VNNLQVVRFENFYKALKPNITTNKNGIVYFNSSDNDEDNACPQRLQDLRLKSPIHSFFLDLKAALIYSGGLYPYSDGDTALADFLKIKNRAGESVQVVFKKACHDFATYEQAFIEVIYDSTGKIAELWHKSVNDIRAGEEVDEFGCTTTYYFSKTWGDITNKRNRSKRNDVANAIAIPAFNPEKKSASQILHIKKYDGTDGVYPVPSYLSSEYWINLTHEIGKYTYNKFANGYHLEGFLYMNSEMAPDQQEEFISDFKRKYQGTDSSNGKIVFLFNNVANSKPEFVPIQDALTNSIFKEYMGEAVKQTVFAHQGSLKILDLSNNDSFGNSNASANDINITRLKYINDVIKTYQNDLLEGFNKLFELQGLGQATLLNETLKLTIPELQPEDTTSNERREIVLGLNPLSKDEPQANVEGNPVVSQLPSASAETQKAQAELRGSVGGVSGILSIQQGVVAGTTTMQSALALLTIVYGFDDANARKLLGQPEQNNPEPKLPTQ